MARPRRSSSSSEEEDDNEETVEVEDGDGMVRRVPGRPAKFQIGRRVTIKGEEGSDDRVAVIVSSKPIVAQLLGEEDAVRNHRYEVDYGQHRGQREVNESDIIAYADDEEEEEEEEEEEIERQRMDVDEMLAQQLHAEEESKRRASDSGVGMGEGAGEEKNADEPTDGDVDDDEFYDAGDNVHAHGGPFAYDGDEYYDTSPDESSLPAVGTFPPRMSDYDDVTVEHPTLGFNLGSNHAWKQCQAEVNHIRRQVGDGMEGVLAMFELLFGKEGELYLKFRKVSNKTCSYAAFCVFMATFFMECRFSITYQRLVDDNDVNTSNYMPPDEYKTLWRLIDSYKKNEDYSPRAWEEFEGAFNTVAADLLIPKFREFKIQGTWDDDKHWYNWWRRAKDVPLDENSSLKHERHIKDNVTGITADVLSYPASGVPVNMHYRRKGETEEHSVITAMKFMFHIGEGKDLPNLSGKAEFAADRGYWRIPLLHYILSLGADVLGTIMRQQWFPFNWGKTAPPANSTDERQFINVSGPPVFFRKRAKHNLGKSGEKDYVMNASAFRNGHSSAVAMTLSTNDSEASCLDFVISTAKSAKLYINNWAHNGVKRFMTAFDLIVGYDPTTVEDGDLIEVDWKSHAGIIKENVKPLCQVQGDKTWMTMRGYACVSSGMNRVFVAKAPYVGTGHRNRKKWELVLSFVGLTNLLPNPPAAAPSDDSDVSDEESHDSEDSIGDDTVEEALLDEIDDDYEPRYLL